MVMLQQIGGATFDLVKENFNIMIQQIPEEKAKQIIEQTQQNLQAGRLPEIVPLN